MRITDFEVLTPDELQEKLLLHFEAGKQVGLAEGLRPDPAAFRPLEGDVVVRCHAQADFDVDREQPAGFEVIRPWTRETTGDRLDVGEMLRTVLALTGMMDVSSIQMLTPEGWAEYRQRQEDRRKKAEAADPAYLPLRAAEAHPTAPNELRHPAHVAVTGVGCERWNLSASEDRKWLHVCFGDHASGEDCAKHELTYALCEPGPSPLAVAAARLVSMVDGPNDALDPDMRAACDAVRALLPEDGR